MKTKIEIEVDIPEGYEFLSYRHAFAGESFIDSKGNITTWGLGLASPCKYIIVIKIKEWVPIDPTKVTLSMLPLTARFNDTRKEGMWVERCLIGISEVFCDEVRFVDKTGCSWEFCEVLE